MCGIMCTGPFFYMCSIRRKLALFFLIRKDVAVAVAVKGVVDLKIPRVVCIGQPPKY